MKCTLWTSAGAKIGIGHLRRSEALAQALISEGVSLRVVFQGKLSLARLWHVENCHFHRVINHEEAITACARHAGPLITDLPGLTAEDAARLRASGCQPLIHLTDSDGGGYPADVFLDGDALDKVFNSRRVGGVEYNILRSSVRALRPHKPWRARRVARVLVCAGGADPGHCTEELLKTAHPDARLTLIAGPAVARSRIRGWRNRLRRGDRLIVDPSNLHAQIQAHDLIVTLGGITSYEAMCLGRPVAAIAWKHMRPYVRALNAKGLLIDLGTPRNAGRQLLRALMNPGLLANRADRAFRLVDGRGAARCAKFIVRRIREHVEPNVEEIAIKLNTAGRIEDQT